MNDDTNAARPGATGDRTDDQIVAERVQAPDQVRGQAGAAASERPTRGRIRDTFFTRRGSGETVPATEAVQTELASVTATTVVMDRSGAEQISGEQVTMERSGAKSVEAKSVQLDRSGVVALGSDNAELQHSSAVQVVAEQAYLSHSTAVFVSAQRATLEHSRVVLFAGTAEGDVHAVLTSRGAAILAAGLTAGAVLFSLLRGRAHHSASLWRRS